MIVEMRTGASKAELDSVLKRVKSLGFDHQINFGTEKKVIAILGGNTGQVSTDVFAVLPGVESVTRIMKSYKLASREFKPDDTLVDIDGVKVGGTKLVVMAGPCAVESEEQLLKTAEGVKAAGASVLRGGAFKPRTSPFSFKGLEEAGLEMLSEVRQKTGLPIVTEVVDTQAVELVAEHADILQVGSRSMQNFTLLTKVGRSQKPVVLKRGFSRTVTEWMNAADYLLAEGNNRVILCERGIRTFENSTRFSLDISSIPVIKRSSHLPIIVEPSHAAEVHSNPAEAMVDGLQSLTLPDFARLMEELEKVARSVGREL